MVKPNPDPEADDLRITPHVVPDNLPTLLKDCLQVANTPATKDMLLMSILTSTSSVMNNVYFRYAHYGKRYYPNLLTFIMAGAASGKGVADLGVKLVEPIHEEIPLLIPGDSTYPAFYTQLYEQDGRGLLFESEGSVITDVWRTSCTNYNTALRKAAEHETLNKSRMMAGVTEIDCPKVSVLLTGTCSQFQALVPSVENGFFSRLNILIVRDNPPFDGSVFLPNNEGTEAERIFRFWGTQFKQWYMSHNQPTEFKLTEEQAKQAGPMMESEYGEYLRQLGDGFHATIVRNGITLMRTAAILSVLRAIDTNDHVEGHFSELVCKDKDFETAMVISTKLLLNAADAYNQIGGKQQPAIPKQKGCYEKDTFLASLPEAFTTGDCIKQAARMGISRRSTERWLQTWTETGVLNKEAHGMFSKISA